MAMGKYGKECADLKLLAIRFIRKSWILLAAVLIGGAVFGIGYFMKTVILAPVPEYETYSMLFADFVEAEDGKPKYYTFNTAGWAGFVKTDEILDKAVPHMKTFVSKEELRNSVSASMDSDYRVVELIVSNPNPELALSIAHAMEQAFVEFASDMKEIDQIRIMTSADKAERVYITVHTYRVVLWGAVLAAVSVLFVMLLKEVLDDAIYVPIIFERRYQIPMLGAVTGTEESTAAEITANLKYLRKTASKIALVGIDAVTAETEKTLILAATGEETVQMTVFPALLQNIGQVEEIRKFDGVILDIPAGKQNGKLIEKTLSLLAKQDCNVIAAVLSNADASLLKSYYFGNKKNQAH